VPWNTELLGATAEVASGNLTLTEPAGVQVGDLLIACISYRSNAAFTRPSGWNDATSQNTGNTTANNTTSIGSGFMAYIVRGTSAPNLTFARTGGDVALGRIISYRGGAPGVSLTATGSTTMGATGTAISVAGVTTITPRDLIVVAACGARANTFSAFAATNPATSSGTNSAQTADPLEGTWQERSDNSTTTGADCTLAIADAVRSTAGATGNITATASASARHVVLIAAFREDIPVALTPTGIATGAPVVGNPTIALQWRLVPTGITATPVVGNPKLSLIALFVPTGITATPVVGSPALSLIALFTPTGITATPIVGSPTVSQPLPPAQPTTDYVITLRITKL